MASLATIAAAVSAGMQTEYGETVLEDDMDKLGAGLAPGIQTVDTPAVEDWHEIGAGGEPAFANSWTNYGGGFNTAAFYKDSFEVVRLKGMIKSGTVGAAAFTLPAGYLPVGTTLFSSVSNGSTGRVDVFTNGIVVPTTPTSNAWVTLDGMTFRSA